MRGDYSYVGSFYGDFTQAGTKAGDYSQLNLSVGSEIGNLTVELYAQNVTNSRSITGVGTVGYLGLDGEGFRMRPRTLGINLGYGF